MSQSSSGLPVHRDSINLSNLFHPAQMSVDLASRMPNHTQVPVQLKPIRSGYITNNSENMANGDCLKSFQEMPL